jgi:hypothetical protein
MKVFDVFFPKECCRISGYCYLLDVCYSFGREGFDKLFLFNLKARRLRVTWRLHTLCLISQKV